MHRIGQWLSDLGLRTRVFLAISLGFLALFAAFSALGERALRESIDRILDERLVISQMAADQIDGLLQQSISELEQARLFADFDPSDPDRTAEAQVLATTYGRVGSFISGIAFLDEKGRVILSHPPSLYRSGSDLSDLPHVAQALERREATFSAPFHDPLSNRPVVDVTVPIRDGERFLGLFSGLVDLSGPSIAEALQQAATLDQTGHAVLVDSQGRSLASTFGLPFLAPGEHATFYRQAIAQGQSAVDTVLLELDLPGEPEGHLHVMAFAPLHTVPWGVAVGGDEDETFAGVMGLRRGLALLGIAALAGAWAATLLGTRRLVHPVERLTQAAQRIASGELHMPLHVPEGGEIGAMAAALERMRRLLLANIEELATWSETLEGRVLDRTEELHQQQALIQKLLRRSITAQEEERIRLSRELHDEIGQMLTAVQLSLDRLSRTLPADDAEAQGRLNRARVLTEQTLTDLRRIITALRPGILDQLGLMPALSWVADHTLRPLGLTVTISADEMQERLPGEIETILFRIAQEAMSNVARHSQASHLTIYLRHWDAKATMTLTDDGQGFDPSTVTSLQDLDSGPAPHQQAAQGGVAGLGLAGMRERASLIGGQVTVESAPGQGTSVHVVVPVSVVAEEGVGAKRGTRWTHQAQLNRFD